MEKTQKLFKHRPIVSQETVLGARFSKRVSFGTNGAPWAELERSMISERTRAGAAAARARGVKFGRKPKLSRQQITQAVKLISQNERPDDVAVSFNVGRSTLYRALAAHGYAPEGGLRKNG